MEFVKVEKVGRRRKKREERKMLGFEIVRRK